MSGLTLLSCYLIVALYLSIDNLVDDVRHARAGRPDMVPASIILAIGWPLFYPLVFVCFVLAAIVVLIADAFTGER